MEENDIELTEKEIHDVIKKQNKINQYVNALGTLRRQYLNAELELLEKIKNGEDDIINLLKFIFQSKSVENIDNWIFDSSSFVFKNKKLKE